MEATGVGRTMEPAGSDVDLVRMETKQNSLRDLFVVSIFVFNLERRYLTSQTALSNVANGVI